MITDMSIIYEARHIIKASAKEFCSVYNEMCGSDFSEPIKSALDGQLRIAEKLESLEKTYCTGVKKPIADNVEVNRYIYSNGYEQN
ncbi:hypothetical protein [Ruminococcus sp.]|uniref:hypothetical protein n=1 Tax=Ruminococcus sp. TaxID=41978 RepID=UPI0025F13EC0|nr:hypothetical protein [Ruminococcus sp.]